MPVTLPDQTTGYVSIGDYLDANRGTLANEAQAVSSDAMGRLGAAQSAADTVIGQVQPGQADYTDTTGYLDATAKLQDARERAQGITDHSKGYGGLAEALKDHYGDSQEQSGFDAN